MTDGTDGRHPARAALLSLIFVFLHPSVSSHFNSPNFHVHLQERMPLLPPFAGPPPLLSPPILGPLLGNNPSQQFSTSLNRGGYPQDNRQDGQVQDTLGTQRLSPLGYPGPQPPPLPPPPPVPPTQLGGIYSQNQLPQQPSYQSGRPPYLTTFLTYQRPIDAMVDITNELGIVVMQDYAYSRGNFAFSPYGVASILVVLFEAARGDSARQVHAALKLPFDREVVRVGFRDIHRSLRGYFNHEGFLSGVTMSQSRTALLPEFRQVLRFYGYDVDLPAEGFDEHPMEPPSPNPTVTLTDALTGGNKTTNASSSPTNLQQSTTSKPSSSVATTSGSDNRKQSTSSAAPSTSTTAAAPSTTAAAPSTTAAAPSTTAAAPSTTAAAPSTSTAAPSTSTAAPSTSTTAAAPSTSTAAAAAPSTSSTTVKESTTVSTTPAPTTAKPQTEQTIKPAMTTLADEPMMTTKLEINSSTMEAPTEKPQTDVTSVPSSSESSLSKLVSEPDSNPASGVFSGLLMGSKLQESFNSLFPNGVESRVGDLPLEGNKVSDMTLPTEATMLPTTGTESLDLREETTIKSHSNDEILEEIESTQDPSDVTSKDTTVETEMPITGSEPIRLDEVTTESLKEEIPEDRKSVPISDSADTLPLEERNVEGTTDEPTTDSTSAPLTTTEPFLAATYIPPPEDTPESSTVSEYEEANKSQNDADTPKEESSKSRSKRWARKRRGPTAELKFWTEVDAAGTNNNNSNRARRGVDDLSMQLQNGMFDTHVAHGQELFTQLPRRSFWVDGVVEEMVPVMEYTAAFPYAYIPRLHAFALEFPLDDERYRLLLLLPAERGAASLGQLLRSLARGQAPLRGVMRSLRLTRLHAVVPAFMAEGFVILTPTLQQMGIWDLFDPRRADLSGMTSTPNLYVRNIEQAVTVVVKSYVEILDIQTRTTAARSRTESFVASHPFLYFVMDAETNVALMAGKVVDPLNSRIY